MQQAEENETDLAAGLRARAARARAKASVRVTAQDLLDKRAAREAAHAETPADTAVLRRRESRAVRVRLGAGTALLLVAGLCITGISTSANQAAAAQASSEARIGWLTTEAETARNPVGSSVNSSADDQLASVRKTSDDVAVLQSQFAPMLVATSTSGNGAPGQGFLNSVEHRKLLAPYFASGTYLLSDKVVYSPTSELGLGANQIDPRLPWFQKANRAGTTGCTWRAVSVAASAAHDLSLTDVTWLCQESATGELLAWADGTWSSDVKAFTTLHVGTTALGTAQSAVMTTGAR